MEYEVRFYLDKAKTDEIIEKFFNCSELRPKERRFEKTSQYNHCDARYNFYSKEIDGRFRLRISKTATDEKCKISWKRRMADTTSGNVNKEEEVEVSIKGSEIENIVFLIENVLKLELVEGYERYRSVFENDEIEISVDEYPFGRAIEFECKEGYENPEEIVEKWVKKFGIDISSAYRLSWDDKYAELCREQNIPIQNIVTFANAFAGNMPTIK